MCPAAVAAIVAIGIRKGQNAVVANPGVTVDDACDDVVYRFEVPGAILDGGNKLPREDPRVSRPAGVRATCTERIPVRLRASDAAEVVQASRGDAWSAKTRPISKRRKPMAEPR